MLGMAIRGRAQADRLTCRLEIISPLPQNVTNSRIEVGLSRAELLFDTTRPLTLATLGSTELTRSRTLQSCMLPTIAL